MPRKNVVRKSKTNTVVPVGRDKRLELLAEALANPLDIRNEDELSLDTGLPITTIRSLQVNPQFMEPVSIRFHQSMENMKIFVLKKVFQAVQRNDMVAARLALRSLGVIGEGDTGVRQSSLPGESVDQDLYDLSDDALDKEIHRLLLATAPDDMVIDYGEINPVYPEGIHVPEHTEHTHDTPYYLEGEEAEVSETSEGETEETL